MVVLAVHNIIAGVPATFARPGANSASSSTGRICMANTDSRNHRYPVPTGVAAHPSVVLSYRVHFAVRGPPVVTTRHTTMSASVDTMVKKP